MNKKTIRRLFIGVMIFLPLQYIMVGFVGLYDAEPWPAFVFPVFDDAFETEQKVFNLEPKDEQAENVQKLPVELFPDIPVSQLSGFIRQNFSTDRDSASISSEAKKWLLNRAENVSETDLRKISLVTTLEYRRFENGSMILDSTSVTQVQTFVEKGM